MVETGQTVIQQLSPHRAEQVGYYRFLDNEAVTSSELIQAVATSCQQAVTGGHVLSISDTTEINLEAHRERLKAQGQGVVGNNQDLGLFVHPALVVQAEDGFVLGISAVKLWNREVEALGKEERQYQHLPIEQKESYKWIEVPQQSSRLLEATPVTMITYVGDREADIYEEFCRLPDEKNHLLIRLCQDRCILDAPTRLFAYLAEQPVVGHYVLDVEADPRRHRQTRQAQIEVRFTPVELQCPQHLKGKSLASLKVYAIEARESNPPAGQKPILWRLLTTHVITTFAQAEQCIVWYRWRWFIERFFAILKKDGLNLEGTELESFAATQRLLILALGAAVRILQLTLGRQDTTHSAQVAFSEAQLTDLALLAPSVNGSTPKQQNPHPVGSLAWAAWVIARLGGWSGYASQRPPGTQTIAQGLERFDSCFRVGS